jgi:hypothetical protein
MDTAKIQELVLTELGVSVPLLSLPAPSVDLQKWAVIACDQYTQDRAYWKKVEDFVGGSPSALNMIFPEVYLEDEDRAQRIKNIHSQMSNCVELEYTKDAVLSPARRGGAFIERETKHGCRSGILLAIDLEKYDWKQNAKTLIRATEGTIAERIPARVEIRHGAPFECPHAMLLLNDEENILMNLLEGVLKNAPYAYNTPLMLDSGSVRARLLYRKNDWDFITDSLVYLLRRSETRLDTSFLFAVGDGNHSLAAAKETWDCYKNEHKNDRNLGNHPARYALVEVVNLFDTALPFNPIHRILINIKHDVVIKALSKLPEFAFKEIGNIEKLKALVNEKTTKNCYGIITREKSTLVESRGGEVATVPLEPVLDNLVKEYAAEHAKIDYIHGDDELIKFAAGNDAAGKIGILMPPIKKENFFQSVAENGPLPRKTFSIGDADEKRFYLECRKLFC